MTNTDYAPEFFPLAECSVSCRICAATTKLSLTRATTCATATARGTVPIHEYISENESRCILLSATPYNKTYHDLSNQLRLFISEEQDLGIRPEQMLTKHGRDRISASAPSQPPQLGSV